MRSRIQGTKQRRYRKGIPITIVGRSLESKFVEIGAAGQRGPGVLSPGKK